MTYLCLPHVSKHHQLISCVRLPPKLWKSFPEPTSVPRTHLSYGAVLTQRACCFRSAVAQPVGGVGQVAPRHLLRSPAMFMAPGVEGVSYRVKLQTPSHGAPRGSWRHRDVDWRPHVTGSVVLRTFAGLHRSQSHSCTHRGSSQT